MEEVAQALGIHRFISDSKDPNSQRFDLRVTLEVTNWTPIFLVDRAVQLDRKPQLRTIEIHNKRADDLLTSDLPPR